MVRRRLYKPERPPARTKGVLHDQAPIGMPDASVQEIAYALFSVAHQAGVIVGRGGSYDKLKDQYLVLGKSLETGKVQDFTIEGREVAELILIARVMRGGPLGSRKVA